MNLTIDKNKMKKSIILLKEYYSKNDINSLANIEFPPSISYGSEEWLIYMFYSCLLDYGMRSKIYHNNLVETYRKYPNIFNPRYVKENYLNNEVELFEIIKNNIHPRYPNMAIKKWISLSVKLSEYNSISKILSKYKNFGEVENFVKDIKEYGQKTGGLLLRIISEANICKLDNNISSIPIDTHDIEISYLNGIISSQKLNSKEIAELSKTYIEVGNEIEINPNIIDKYLWEIGNRFCNKRDCLNCPLNKNCQTKKVSKNKQFDKLIDCMSKCEKCLFLKKKNGLDCSLINIFKNKELAKNIPSIWTDWFNRLDSEIMIIGQDWGPFNDMEKLYKMYLKDKSKDNWYKLLDNEKSLTKKMLNKYLMESAFYYGINLDNDYINKIYITNGVMCARKGNNYRGDNIDLKKSTINCSEYLKRQIEIVKPKIILTLGYYPLLSLSKIYNFKIEQNLTSTIKSPFIKIKDYIIIPLYHPTAQIKKEEQLKQYKIIWHKMKNNRYFRF